MKIYVAHSTNFDFEGKLYKPLRGSWLNNEHDFVLAHEVGAETNTKEIISGCDLVLAEVSEPSTGEGIELGWANMLNVPIVCIYERGKEPSSSLNYVTQDIIEYIDFADMLQKIGAVIQARP